ncbi:MAG: T9SS C-terminal target domain-containing protein [Ignavibacteriae bacterium]|nr:MAG: T9SS C-terminal target domain-containing protein [Ignavibacteriota bacterium]
MAMDPNNSNIVYCGTGEANTSTDSYAGFGLLKSTNKGETWALSGLENSRHIGAITVHPMNSNLIYTAAAGGLYSKGPDRGVYKSTDAGATWQKVFFMNDSTSAIDVIVDHTDLNIVYAAMFERLRGPSFRHAAGVSSGVFKSTNAGLNWVRLTTGLPVPAANIGRICLAVAPSNANIVYALYRKTNNPSSYSHDNVFEGFYRSTNKGGTWTKMPDGILPGEFSNFGWYFGLIKVDPVNPDIVYCGDIDIYKTINGGTSWINITNSYSGTFDQQHPDQHTLWINPAATNKFVNGNDGGLFTSSDGGSSWLKSYDLPLSQTYASTIDYLLPQRKYTGTQDNGTVGTKTGLTMDWELFYGGDGFYCLVDYSNSNVMYAEYQNGGIGRSTNGGNSYVGIQNGLDLSRTNWSSPYTMDLLNPSVLYFGSYKLHKTTNRGTNWTAISPDLTRGPGNGRLGTITCISTAPKADSLRVIYVGTDDWKVSVSTNTGASWTDITGSLPQRYVTDVVCDKRNPAIAYVTLSGYNLDLNNTHIFRTTNYGAVWTNISSNMPNVPVNSFIIDYNRDGLLYAGCDVGVFYSTNTGASWQVLGTGLPNSAVFDINYHQPTKKLVAGTHGRSMFEIDLSTLISVENITSHTAKEYKLHQNYPNPFNPSTTVKFEIPKSGNVKIAIYDINGRLVSELLNKQLTTGQYEIEWNASRISSGIYFYRIESGSFNEVKKMSLVK